MNARPYEQNQSLLFPPNIRQLIADDHPAVIINDIVNTMDLRSFYSKISTEGPPSYHPAMMLKVLIYAYANGIFSSRKIQKAVQESVPFIFLAAWQKPDFRTISDFRKNNLREIKKLFSQLLDYCSRMQMISLAHISIDGSRIKANAAGQHTWSKEKIDQTIKQLLDQANQADSSEDLILGSDKSGEEVPAPVRKQADRIKELQKIKKQLEESGRNNINTTDPDAVFMKTQQGITTALNAQIAVEEQNQLILAADVTADPADVAQLIPMVEQVKNNIGKPEILSADSGYSSGENLKALEGKKIDGYIPDPVFQGNQRKPVVRKFFERSSFTRDEAQDCFICPTGQKLFYAHTQKTKNNQLVRVYRCLAYADCPVRNQCTKRSSSGRMIYLSPYDKELRQMRDKLDSETGKRIYRRRQAIVEPVFATLKRAIGFSRFLLRGLPKARGEFILVCIAHNIRKLTNYLRQKNACTQAG